jgi:hypothetical protein
MELSCATRGFSDAERAERKKVVIVVAPPR